MGVWAHMGGRALNPQKPGNLATSGGHGQGYRVAR